MTIFYSSKNPFTIGLLWFTVVFLLLIPLIPNSNEESQVMDIIFIIIMYFIAAMVAWILLDTKYVIKENELLYNAGPIRGTIKVENIRKIVHWNKWYVPSFLKLALDKDGVIVYYDKFDDLFISPKNKEDFINILCEINPGIEIVQSI